MIEKLNLEEVNNPGEATLKAFSILNQLVDAVNKHEDIIRQIGEWGTSKGECLWCENLTAVNLDDRMIGCTTLDIPESYKTYPYAEQHQWRGKLCKFWDDSDKPENCVYGILCNIFDLHHEDCPFQCGNGEWYEHCEPVKPDSDIIYKGEQQ